MAKGATARTKRTPGKKAPETESPETGQQRFLRLYAEFGNATEAAKGAGIGRTTVYEWRAADPDFAAAWLAAEGEYADRLEAEVRRRALKGVDEPVFYQGKEVGHIRRYSDTLLMFHTKAKRPEYRDRVLNEHSGPNGAPIPVNVSVRVADLSDEELRELIMGAGGGGAVPPATG